MRNGPREKLLYVSCLYVGSDRPRPDFLATVDVDPGSSTYQKIIHETAMPTAGDELHHFGWNACSSCHDDASRHRRFLVVPGMRTSRIHILDVADPAAPKLVKAIDGDEVKKAVGLSAPHTVHCLADGNVMISMLGDAEGNGPGGFLLLDDEFNLAGRWEKKSEGMNYNYDFWYQPRRGVMLSSEWAAPNTFQDGFNPEHVQDGRYGRHIHLWDWSSHELTQSIDLGEDGLIPLEIRFHHDPDSEHAFVGAALSSTMWHVHRGNGKWQADQVIAVPPHELEGWPMPVPGLITDLVLSLDDRWLYFSNWLHGDIRQYDVSDPAHPKLCGQVWCGGVLREIGHQGRPLAGGPQMLQLSLDGRRLYVTNSLFSSWDNQFYPGIAERGSYLLQVDCDPAGGMTLNPDFHVDFSQAAAGPCRAHEMRYPGGDCTSDIWI